ncbi:hypothetical protein J2Y03_005750 [Neobacillus niacini]|nr:hypothetical protein [Neobacillus niacini]
MNFVLVEDQYFFGSNHALFSLPCPKSPRLQTLSCFFSSFLSEVPTASDTITLFQLFLVRSHRGFRHYLAFSALPCPKSPRLQTLSRFFSSSLSEARTASDTILPFQLFLVRSPHGFRHYLAFSALPCPKSAQLRTPSLFFSSFLSEVPTASDTITLFSLFLVRSPHGFRHYLAYSALPCPKPPRLQTLSCLFNSSLSEVPTASDTITLFQLFLVRSPHGFGHYHAFSALPCPNLNQ